MATPNLTEAQKQWADAFVGTHVKGTSTSWMIEGIAVGYVLGQRGNGIYLHVGEDKQRLYRAFPKALRV